MTDDHDAYSRAVEKAEALLTAYARARQGGDANAERLANEYRVALAESERLMPEEERLEVSAMVEGVGRLVAYARALERGDTKYMRQLYEEMTDEERAGVQHAHDEI
jgi:hypothetical protein